MEMVLKNVTVIGSGVMGSGISQVAAQTGHNVTLVDVSTEILEKACSDIKLNLKTLARRKYPGDASGGEQFVSEILQRLKTSTNVEESVQDADIVIEAIVESIHKKQELFKSLDKAAPKRTLFASNTSSLLISDISSATERKDRFGGLHFFNPVPLMKLVEVIKTNETSEDTYNKLMEFSKQLRKTPITCKDTPGFVVNRLLMPYLSEAAKMLERGDASAKDIDTAMKFGAGFPMGPFELLDYIGLDTVKFVLDGWREKYPDNEIFHPSKTLDKLVREGKLGMKSGEGFYDYKSHKKSSL